MKILIVGGDFGIPKESSIIKKISDISKISKVINGGTENELPTEIEEDLIIWMPNIPNEIQKHYPKKSKGSVLICSKVMRDGYTEIDAVSRIFKMQGNAVIAIYNEDGKFRFKLIDALGNTWIDTKDLTLLYNSIVFFYHFTKSAIRIKSIKSEEIDTRLYLNDSITSFININKKLSNHIQNSCGMRFFGNLNYFHQLDQKIWF